jgi:hypothetical protein
VTAEVLTLPIPWPEVIDFTADHDLIPPFPTHVLPHPFSTFVADVADRMQVPADYVGIPLIIAAATMIGREFRLAPKRHDDWSERACLWGGVIAPPGERKTPAAEDALRPLSKMQRELWDRYRSEHAAWKLQKEDVRGPEPLLETVITNEATVEALVGLMSDEKNANARGILLYRDELAGWFEAMNKYRSGGDDRQFFLQCWSGGPYRVDRKGTGVVCASDLYLSIYGTIQPDIVAKVFRGGDGDGMTSRFGLLVWPRPLSQIDVVDRQPNFAVRAEVLSRLREIRSTIAYHHDDESCDTQDESAPIGNTGGTLRFAGEAYAVFNKWLLRNQNRPERKEDTAFAVHVSKYPGLFARLALTLHFMKHGAGAPRAIGCPIAESVRALIDDYLELHARRIYGLLGAHPARAGAARIANWLRSERVKTFSVRDVRRRCWKEFAEKRDQDSITEAINYLEAQGWVRIEQKAPGTKGGRPTIRAVVNPEVAEP